MLVVFEKIVKLVSGWDGLYHVGGFSKFNMYVQYQLIKSRFRGRGVERYQIACLLLQKQLLVTHDDL